MNATAGGETKTQARKAGLLYVLVALTAPIGLIYVPGRIIETGNATATAEHIRALASLLRLGIASELFHQAVEVFLVLVLYRLMKPVDPPLARQMAVLGFIPIPIVFLNVLNEIAALTVTSGVGYLAVFDKTQLDALAMLFLRLHSQGLQVAAVFWGLWLIPFGVLIIRSRFIPSILGISIIVGGIGYVLGSLSSLVIPDRAFWLFDAAGILQLGELPIIAWLVIWGARVAAAAPTASR